MGARRAAGAAVAAAGLALALLAWPTIIAQERAVSEYVQLSDEVSSEGVDWDALQAANPAVVAWCRVEGTSIDLPVCQATDDEPGFWLTHDVWGNESPAGTPYVDHRASAGSRHVLCYGHHLAGTGGMFSDVYRCHEQGEFDRWLTGCMTWETPAGRATLRPLCASSQDMGFEPAQRFTFEDDADFTAWLESLVALSSARARNADELAARASRAVTLVTCSSDLAGQRARTLVTFVT